MTTTAILPPATAAIARPELRSLREDPLPWLLERDTPAVRHLALRHLLDLADGHPDVAFAQAAAMAADPIASILAAQRPEG